MDKFSFFDLRVYQEAKELVKSVYTLLDKFPKLKLMHLVINLEEQLLQYLQI